MPAGAAWGPPRLVPQPTNQGTGTSAIPTATVRLRVREQVLAGAAVGDGPVDAACKAISQVTKSSAKLARYEIRAVTSGMEAIGEVTVQLEEGGRKAMGCGAPTLAGTGFSTR